MTSEGWEDPRKDNSETRDPLNETRAQINQESLGALPGSVIKRKAKETPGAIGVTGEASKALCKVLGGPSNSRKT